MLAGGRAGETYNVGGGAELTTLEVVHAVCRALAERRPGPDYTRQIQFVTDRPGHDRRYAIDSRKIRRELGWQPAETFESGLRRTVDWYLDNAPWLAGVQSSEYRQWIDLHYAPA